MKLRVSQKIGNTYGSLWIKAEPSYLYMPQDICMDGTKPTNSNTFHWGIMDYTDEITWAPIPEELFLQLYEFHLREKNS